MKIRRADLSDAAAISSLFYETITHINKAHYTPAQIEAWRAGATDTEKWTRKINEQYFFVAELENEIVGFSSITPDGYLDYMFVHKDHQGRGIATKLLEPLEQIAHDLNLAEIWPKSALQPGHFLRVRVL